MKRLYLLSGIWLILAILMVVPVYAQEDAPAKDPLSLLLNQEIYSASRVLERAFDSPYAVYVLSSEDIRKLNARNIPEALRNVPGLHVAQISSSTYAISTGGFNYQYSNKLLVMIDGRTIYTPLVSGTLWNNRTPAIENIDKIEVVLGPGGALWGTNAVNGIINIITKDAGAAIGKKASVTAGTNNNYNFTYRQGMELSKGVFFRGTAQHSASEDASFVNPISGQDTDNKWTISNAGFRVDWNPAQSDTFTLDTQFGHNVSENYFSRVPVTTTPFFQDVAHDMQSNYGHILGKWDHWYGDSNLWTLKSYLNYEMLKIGILEREEITFDTDFQNSFYWNPKNQMTFGGDFRVVSDDIRDSRYIDYEDMQQTELIYSAFAQNKHEINKKLFFTLGAKLEYSDISDLLFQPNARLAFYPSENQTLWAGVARAYRRPNRGEQGITTLYPSPTVPGTFLAQRGNPSYKSEELVSYEVGYRFKPTTKLALNVSSFVREYDDLRSFSPLPSTDPNISVAALVENEGKGQAYGAVIEVQWQATDDWKLITSYDFLKLDLESANASSNASVVREEGLAPEQQFRLTSDWTINPEWEFITTLYAVDALPAVGVDSYVKLDANLHWHLSDDTSLIFSGRNLTDDRHSEFSPGLYARPLEINRTFFAKLQMNF